MNVSLITLLLYLSVYASPVKFQNSCKSNEYFEPNILECRTCPTNVSLVPSTDGYRCICEEHSVPAGINRCKPCNITEVVSSDGRSCVSRRCQASGGRIVCRKCPADYISVTQNFDGSPMKEVLCVKCSRGYKARDNQCVRCESCTCYKHDVVVQDICVPKKYVVDRPKYEESRLHPAALLDVVKQEFLCSKQDSRACQNLARACVNNYYSPDVAGPCRFWMKPDLVTHKGLPQLTLDSATESAEEIYLDRGENELLFTMAVHPVEGGFQMLQEPSQLPHCTPPMIIVIGEDVSRDCFVNVSNSTLADYNGVFELYIKARDDFKPLPITLLKPTGYYVERNSWNLKKFRKFFLIQTFTSTVANITNTDYLRTLHISLRTERNKHSSGALKLQINVEARYSSKSPLSDVITMSLRVENEMPNAGVLRGLEIWGSVLSACLILYAVIQWRGVIRRGGLHIALIPILGGCIADALYFAIWFSTLHALAAEAGALGLTLALSGSEEQVIRALVFSVVCLKFLKLIWINWNQCRCDVFFVDWAEYIQSYKEPPMLGRQINWKAVLLAKEWNSMQTRRRASPGVTITITLIILHLLQPWQSYLPRSNGYKWAIAGVAWWSAYTTVLITRWVLDKAMGTTENLAKICSGVGLSLLVFQEDLYAHYVHGRNDDLPDTKVMSGPLSVCRIVCAPKLRTVYKKLSAPGFDNSDVDSNQTLLSRFLAAFFERALDGLNWVACERTIMEKLMDIEITVREGGNASILLYDSGNNVPSCLAVTWWGEEWTLGTFDAMLFGSIFLATDHAYLAALSTVSVWQVIKHTRTWFGSKNLKEKTGVQF